jgi:biotin carboxyl carrier protein
VPRIFRRPGGFRALPPSSGCKNGRDQGAYGRYVLSFTRARSPPYVEVGQISNPAVRCIIEAMKLMNEIKSEIKGKIVQILVDNAEPVEFGQSMFIVEPF